MDDISRIELEMLSESDKDKDSYLHTTMRHLMSSINLYDMSETQKAYRLKNGKRNLKEFEFITKKYGLEFPATLSFTPLISRHLKVLQGQNDITELKFDVTCADNKGIEGVEREKKISFLTKIKQELDYAVKSGIKTPDDVLNNILKDHESFKSSLEIQGQHMIGYQMQSKNIKEHSDIMFGDLFTAGKELYQVKVIEPGIAPIAESVNPLHAFFDKTDKIFVADCDRILIRKPMLITEIINKYGHLMEKCDIELLQTRYYSTIGQLQLVDMKHLEEEAINNMYSGIYNAAFEWVHYGEWKSNNKHKRKDGSDGYILDLYACTCIGDKTFVDCGKVKYVQRDEDNPYYCRLTINGMCYNDRNGSPYSMFLATEGLQNDYDVYKWHHANMVALSGVKATYVPLENIPLHFGNDPAERIMKMQYYMKNGIIPLSLSQDGAVEFNNYGQAVDMTLGNGGDAIINVLKFIEETASMITGVNAQALSQIGQNDGLGTTKIALNQTALVTQPLHTMHRTVMREFFNDILNACRICYPNGLKGSYGLGLNRKTFSIGKEFKASKYNVFVSNTGLEAKQIEKLNSVIPEIIKSGIIDIDAIVDLATLTSLTELKARLKQSAAESKGKQLQQLQQQMEQAEKLIQQLQQQLQQSQQNGSQIESKKIELETQKINNENNYKLGDLQFKRDKLDVDKELKNKELDLEGQQIIYSNKSLEVKDV